MTRENKIKTLFVCLGNICRSPMAEALFKYMVEEEEPQYAGKFHIESCGTSTYHVGEKAHIDTLRVLEQVQASKYLAEKRARSLQEKDFFQFDYILAMDRSNLQDIEEKYLALSNKPENKPVITLLRDYDPVSESVDVPDPYYDTERGFEQVFDILHRSLSTYLNQFKNQL